MVDVSSMSDSELRTKLIEYGFPVMPITGTTRKVMEKKIKILMENKKKVNSEGRRSLTRYSSEEESDVDIKVSRKDKAKRATMAAPPSRVTLRKSTRKADTDSDNETRKPVLTEEKKVTTRTTKITKVESGFDTGSDSESEILEKTYKTTVNNHDYKPSYIHSPISSTVSQSYMESSRKYSPPKIAEDVVSKPISVSYSSNQSPSRYTSYGSSASDYAADRLNQIRSRLSLGTPSYDRSLYSSSISTTSTVDKDEQNIEAPFLSNFTKRLSQLSNNSVKIDDYKNDIIKEHDTNGSGSFTTRTYIPSRPLKRDFTRDYQSGKQTNTNNNLVSFAVIALAFLFFIILGIVYMGLHSGQTAIETSQPDLKVSYCDTTHSLRPGVNCMYSAEVRDAVKVYEIIKSELLKRSIDNHCLNPRIKPYMLESDIGPYVKRMSSDGIKNINMSIINMEILSLTNPQWDVSLLKITNDVLDDMPIAGPDELYTARTSSSIALSVLEPNLPWSCTIYNKLAAIIQSLVVLGVGLLSVYSLNIGYKYYKHYQQKQKDELHYMVERIIDTLQTNSTEGGDNFLVINHVRDMILPINDRARMERTWRKAVDFINRNESRVRTEEQVVQGEPYEVWRWLGSPNLNMSGSPRNKSWQGQAFETQVGSVNSLPCSPTPCLKIRGMVDDGDRNFLTIREAVLSKCTHKCRIMHCAVDTNSKCVYLKCADQGDAAIAYGSLHGWWYAGNLVTVKYLRLERYMQRYPNSPVSGPPYLKAVQPATD